MALQQLSIHLSNRPALSRALPSSSSSPSPRCSPLFSAARSKPWRVSLRLDRRLLSIAAAAVSSSSTTDPPPAAVEEPAESSSELRNRLIAQNIPWTATADDIKNLFAKHGTVIDVEVPKHNKSKNRGLAFVIMASQEEALAALTNLKSYELEGREIKVDYARSVRKAPPPAIVPPQVYSVFVGNLSWKVRSQDLQQLFSDNKDILSADVIFQTNPRRPAGYGFVGFSSKEAAEAAVATYNGKSLMGRPVRLVLKEIQTDGYDKKSNEGENASSEVGVAEDISKPAAET